jgi:hypothetical protein
MRVMLIMVVLAVVGAAVAVALGERDSGGRFYGFRPHAPESRDERSAAASALAYARAIVDGDAARACPYAAGETFRRLRCARHPRSDWYLTAVARVRAYHVSLRGDRADVWLDGIDPGPGHSFQLRRVDSRWRVVSDTAFGLA